MKRYEAEKIISETMEEFNVKTSYGLIPVASMILVRLEAAGMLPPQISKYAEDGATAVYPNEWEDEEDYE